ncbi:nitroreductase family protein [Streptomyces sparsogenes]|uniref:nitroreductase family protein n=1 Tax=Streptomyces sparsogenes TaxID=67365 RepID=UPI00384AF49A
MPSGRQRPWSQASGEPAVGRAFRPDAVPQDTMRAIFSLAGAAPSNSNAQPWRVEVVSGAARERLADALQAAHAAHRTSVDFPYSTKAGDAPRRARPATVADTAKDHCALDRLPRPR